MIVLPGYSEPSRTTPGPLIDPSDAARPGRALIQIGQDIRGLSPVAQGIADDIAAAETSATLSAAKRKLAERQAAFEQSLATDHNAAGYKQRLESEVIAPAYSLITPDLNGAAQQQLRQTIDGWASDLRIGTDRTAQFKAITRAKDELALTRDAFLEGGELDPYLAHLADQAWLSPEERALEERHARRLFADRQVEASIVEDPAAYLEAPITSGDPAKDRARLNLARATLRQQTADATDDAVDLILTDKIGTPEAIDEFFPDLRPAARAELTDFLARHLDGRAELARRDPATQNRIAGEISALLSTYDPTVEGFDADFVAIATRIAELPAGPLRDELSRNLKTIRDDAFEAVDTNEEAAFKAIDQAFADGRFGAHAPGPKQTTAAAIDAGLLTDRAKLAAAGFSPEQVDQLTDEELKPTARLDLFRQLYPQRAAQKTPEGFDIRQAGTDATETLTGYDLAAFQAAALGASSIDYESPADRLARDTALEAYGEAKTELARWFRANPEASRDEAKVNAKVRELGIKADVRKLKERTTPPRPTAMNLPTPLAPLAPAFESYGRLYGIDPRFLAAISMLETARGTSSAYRNKKNAMGVSDAKGPIAFGSVEASVERMARVLASKTGPYRNAHTLEEIAAIYAPPGAANDPKGTNGTWAAGVATYLRQLGISDPYKLRLR